MCEEIEKHKPYSWEKTVNPVMTKILELTDNDFQAGTIHLKNNLNEWSYNNGNFIIKNIWNNSFIEWI